MVVTNEIAYHMDLALHTVSMIPGFTGQFILRELGIAIPALLLVAKVGAAITAEVGSMKVTEQIDALKLLGIDPISYLVFPALHRLDRLGRLPHPDGERRDARLRDPDRGLSL